MASEDLDAIRASAPATAAAGDLIYGVRSAARKGLLAEEIAGVFNDTVQEYTKQHYFLATTLTAATNVSWDLDDDESTEIVLDQNVTMDNPTNMQAGGRYTLRVIQDSVGSRTITWGTAYKWSGGTAPTLTTGVDSIDVIRFRCDGTAMYGLFEGDFS